MVTINYEMNKVMADIFITMVHEYDLPVTAKVGVPRLDGNGDTMVNVDLQYDEMAKVTVSKYLSKAMNQAAEVLSNEHVAI